MNKLLSNIFYPERNANRARFDFPFFRNKEIQNEIERQGYSVQPLLDNSDVVQLNHDFFQLLKMLDKPLPETHWTSGRVDDVRIRSFARRCIDKILPQRLEIYFDNASADFIGGIFLAKRPSPISELTSHQDSSHTDETKYPAVYAWVALVDTDINTGAMHVLKGSHLWGNRFRSLNIPWLYDGMQHLIFQNLTPIPMKAGEVLFFDSATIHHSSSNMGSDIRTAINYFIKPREALFLHHYKDENTLTGKIEVYNVDIDFFYNFDFMQRPPCPPYSKLDDETYDVTSLGEEEMIELIKRYSL